MYDAPMASAPRPGDLIGRRYQLIELAGHGGMADVWRADVVGDLGFRRPIAIKQMHPALSDQPTYVQMFVEEARLGASLESPNLAEIRDFVFENGNYYIVMEWIEGLDLGTWIRWHTHRNEGARWELAATIGIGVLRALAACHERVGADGKPWPVVHRDVSPHNIMITTRGLVKLIDLGLAMAGDRTCEATEPGVVKGKMSYLSPEIVSGARPTPPADQFAVGSVLWETLVGRKLFDGQTDYDTYIRVRDCQVQPLKAYRPDVPADIAHLITRALAPKPEERFASAREFARQIGTVLKHVQLRRDLHAVLARSVNDARASLGMASRSDDVSAITPVAELRPDAVTPAPFGERLRGLRHRLPLLFGRKKA